MIRCTALAALALGLCVSSAALARDSRQIVCSGFAEVDSGGSPDKMGISIDFYDHRAESGSGRTFVLSSIYQGKLYQGTTSDKSEEDKGRIALKHSRSQLFVGSFKLETQQDDTYSMSLDGKINQDPDQTKKLYPAKAKLPCVDLSL